MTVTLYKKDQTTEILKNVSRFYTGDGIYRVWFEGKWKSIKYDFSEISDLTINLN